MWLAAWLGLSLAYAGDPCPIDFRLTNLGPLDKPGAVPIEEDKIFQDLRAFVEKSECTTVEVALSDAGTVPLGKEGENVNLQGWRLQQLLMDSEGGFRCKDAHEVLIALSATNHTGFVVYQRGTRRVLLTTAGWGTVCMDTTELEKGGEAALKKLWDGATGKLVKDRHDNP